MFFVTKGTYNELLDRAERLGRKVDEHLEEISRLRKKISEFENGGRTTGKYCTHCSNYGGDKIEFRNGVVVGTERVCLKEVPCPDFERSANNA
jgi:hypothetical protein